MKTFTLTRAVQAALIAAVVGGTSSAALADIKDYKFELVDQSVQTGPDKVITVRLLTFMAADSDIAVWSEVLAF